MKSVLDSRQILAAKVLAEVGSFTIAGQQLCLTQSAVSHAIKALEEEVGCRLFTRTGKGVKITPAGEHFLRHLDKILESMEAARTVVAPRTVRGKERLRLGVGLRARQYIMPVVLPAFQREFPNKLVTIEPQNYVQNLELLEAGLLDFVFAVNPAGRPEFGYVHLFEDELRFIVGQGHPWARDGRVVKEDLAGDTLLVTPSINNLPQLLADYLRAEKVKPRHSVELADIDSIRILLKSNMAVGVLSPVSVEKELREGSLVSLPLGSRPLLRQWGLAHLARQPLTAMDKRFIELCQQAVLGILSRLQGQLIDVDEKKRSTAPDQVASSEFQYGGIALTVAVVLNFGCDVLAGLEGGLTLLASG